MKTVIAYRQGAEKIRIPAEVRNGGVLWSGGKILLNGDLIPQCDRDRVITQMALGNITPDIEAMGLRLGDNGNGLIVRWASDIDAECRAKAQTEYDALPAEVKAAREERNAIEQLYSRSHRALHHDTDDDNVSRGYSLQAQADAMLKAWRQKYPKMAMLEDADNLMAEASKQDELASGALTYDSDGLLSPADQQRRYDEHKVKASQLRAEAKALKEAANV